MLHSKRQTTSVDQANLYNRLSWASQIDIRTCIFVSDNDFMSETSNGNAMTDSVELIRVDGSVTKVSSTSKTDGDDESIGVIFEDENERSDIPEEKTHGGKSRRGSASICDVSSVLMEEVYRCSSPSCLSTSRSKKQQRSISDPRASLQPFLRRTLLTNISPRRSTVVSLPNTSRQQQQHTPIDENNDVSPVVLDQVFYTNSDSDENRSYPNVHTRIKLSLPSTNSSRKLTQSRHHHRHTISASEGSEGVRVGEFILPTNPPITVTIEPQELDLHNNRHPCQSIHDDQICSSTNLIGDHRRTSIDPSIKAGSTIVTYFMDLLKPSDNKLAMKLFGSRKGLLKERLRQQRAGHCIIHPCSNFR